MKAFTKPAATPQTPNFPLHQYQIIEACYHTSGIFCTKNVPTALRPTVLKPSNVWAGLLGDTSMWLLEVYTSYLLNHNHFNSTLSRLSGLSALSCPKPSLVLKPSLNPDADVIVISQVTFSQVFIFFLPTQHFEIDEPLITNSLGYLITDLVDWMLY